MLHFHKLFPQLPQDLASDQFQVQAGNIIINNACCESDFNQKELPILYNRIGQQKQQQEEKQIQNEKERMKEIRKFRSKDLSLRVFKVLAPIIKQINNDLFTNTLKTLKINQKYVNLAQMSKIYQQPQLRPIIAKIFLSGQFRRSIMQAKRRSSTYGDNKKNSNSLLKQAIFETFAFVQGGTYCRSSLKQPILGPKEQVHK